MRLCMCIRVLEPCTPVPSCTNVLSWTGVHSPVLHPQAAFDAPSAYLLVHMHHYMDQTPQWCFDRLHEVFPTNSLIGTDHVRA